MSDSNPYRFRKLAVIGAGNMGSGIAQKMATEGFDVVLVDLDDTLWGDIVGDVGWQNIEKGTIHAAPEIWWPARAADIAVALAKEPGRPIEEIAGDSAPVDNGFAMIPTVITPVVGVDRDNIDATVIASGHVTREEVYGK